MSLNFQQVSLTMGMGTILHNGSYIWALHFGVILYFLRISFMLIFVWFCTAQIVMSKDNSSIWVVRFKNCHNRKHSNYDENNILLKCEIYVKNMMKMRKKYREKRKKENKHGKEKARWTSLGTQRGSTSFNLATRLWRRVRRKRRKEKSLSSYLGVERNPTGFLLATTLKRGMIEESERKRKKKKSRKFMKKEKNQVAKKILPRYFWCQDTSVGFFLQP